MRDKSNADFLAEDRLTGWQNHAYGCVLGLISPAVTLLGFVLLLKFWPIPINFLWSAKGLLISSLITGVIGLVMGFELFFAWVTPLWDTITYWWERGRELDRQIDRHAPEGVLINLLIMFGAMAVVLASIRWLS
jgi:hypothetical protein